MARANTSFDPPGGNGTTMVTGLVGYCASAGAAESSSAASHERGFLTGRLLGWEPDSAAIPVPPSVADKRRHERESFTIRAPTSGWNSGVPRFADTIRRHPESVPRPLRRAPWRGNVRHARQGGRGAFRLRR